MSTVMITGANRGLGLEFTRQYLADGWRVLALCREPDAASDLLALRSGTVELQIMALDVADTVAIKALAQRLRGEKIDVLINNAGLFGPKPGTDGDLRQNFGHLDEAVLHQLFAVNSLAPLKMAEAFHDQVMASEHRTIVTITSTMGAISATSGGFYAYRMSKAAVNMAMASLASELAPAGLRVGLLNPGWVRTDMGGPKAPLEAAESIRSMRRVIAGLTPEQSGQWLNYDGSVLPW